MIKIPHITVVILAGLFLFSGNTAWSAIATVEGFVKDAHGQPLGNAEIRIEGLEGIEHAKIVKTNATGHYTCSELYDGTYRVSLVVNGTVKASIANVSTKVGAPTTLNFELTKGVAAKPLARGKHFVWTPGATGTNLRGIWVEVDDTRKEKKPSRAEMERTNRSAGETIRRVQDSAGAVVNR